MSNNIRNLKGKEGSYTQGESVSATQVHDAEAIGLLRTIAIEMKKMNIHLEYLSGINAEDYNVEEIE